MTNPTESTSLPESIGSRRFHVQIAGLDLQFVDKSLTDPIPTGRQIAEAFASGDPDEVIVLQVRSSGALEELRPEETTDLMERGIERFIVVSSDRSFRLEIDGQRQEWPAPVISAMTVKMLGSKHGDDIIAVLVQAGAGERELEDDELVDLTQPGLERFVLKEERRDVRVTVNGRPVQLRRGLRTGLEIKQAAIDQGVPIQIDFVLSLEVGPGHTRIIGDAEPIKVKQGQQFVAIADDDNS